MSAYESYEVVDDGRRPRHHYHSERDRRDTREPRYVETQETYVRAPSAPTVPEPKYVSRQTEIVRAPRREDSDLSIEEVRRDFPPPGSSAYVQQRTMVRDDRYGQLRARSAERDVRRYSGDYLDDPRRSHNDLGERRNRRSYVKEEKIVSPRRRSLSRNQKIIAAVGGAALAVGGKELWDRKEANGRDVKRNPLGTAALGAAGAFAGYEGAELYSKHGGKYEEKVKTYVATQGRGGEVAEYEYSDEEDLRPKRSKSRRKSIVEGALGLAGLGAAAKATSGHRRRGSADSYYSDRSTKSRKSRRSRSVGPEGAAKYQQAAKAALLAGATEAFRVRNEPGGWGGAKGKRILTAAIGAGGIDAAADRDPDHKSKRHILEAVVGGLAGNRLVNGSRKNVEYDDDGRSIRSRSRSRSRGPSGGNGLAALATAGLGAVAGKKLLDRSRSRSRGGDSRRRRYSPDSYDSRSPSPRRGDRKDRRRSKSVTDIARKGLAAIGLGETAEHEVRERRRGDGTREVEETHVVRKSRGSRGDVYGDPRYADSRSSVGGRSRRGNKDAQRARGRGYSDSESSLGSSSDDEKRIKKMKGKQLLTAGLATVATIHAAHNIYQSMEKRDARHKAVQEGEMTPEEARKLKAKATLQDAASVGIAALGIKGAISEIKEANEMRKECKEFNEKKEERHRKRLERLEKDSRDYGRGSRDGRSRNDRITSGSRYDSGPRYVDGNPYATALPAPPVGYYDGR
ncbi:hypothetical protein PVAG01_01509 [Phlyctema vagabunda]|uniref:DUF3824 domain-containing protein n=1 Tax=Phlyctema vagabunda TaxID=108571 RepID=A0ABR4PXQ1_9HELO